MRKRKLLSLGATLCFLLAGVLTPLPSSSPVEAKTSEPWKQEGYETVKLNVGRPAGEIAAGGVGGLYFNAVENPGFRYHERTLQVPQGKKLVGLELWSDTKRQVVLQRDAEGWYNGYYPNTGTVRFSNKEQSNNMVYHWWRAGQDKTKWAFDTDGVRHWRKSQIGITNSPAPQSTYFNERTADNAYGQGTYTTNGSKPSWYVADKPVKMNVFYGETPGRGNVGWATNTVPITVSSLTADDPVLSGIKLADLKKHITIDYTYIKPEGKGGLPANYVGAVVKEFTDAQAITQGYQTIWYETTFPADFYFVASDGAGATMRNIHWYGKWQVDYHTKMYKYQDLHLVAKYEEEYSTDPYLIDLKGENFCKKDGSIQMGVRLVVPGLMEEDATKKSYITWTSSNKAIATVSKGKVTAKKAGTVTITATYAKGKPEETSISKKIKIYTDEECGNGGGDGGGDPNCPDGNCPPDGTNPTPNPPPNPTPNPTPPTPPSPPSGDIKTEVVYHPPSWNTGTVDWGLHVDNATVNGATPTKMSVTNNLPIGSHYAQNPENYTISGVVNGNKSVNGTAPVKGNINYNVTYSYTDYEIKYFVCTAYEEITDDEGNVVGYGDCTDWQYTHSEPDWSQSADYDCTVTLNADHNYNDRFEVSSANGNFLKTMKIGQKDTVQAGPSCSTIGSKTYSETVSRDIPDAEKVLETQTFITLHENDYKWNATEVVYGTLPSVFPYIKVDKQGEVTVPDLDAAYKEQYRNTGNFVKGNFSIPLEPVVVDKTMTLFGQEEFMLARSTGFTYPVDRDASHATKVQTVRAAYEAYTGETLDLTTNPTAHEKVYDKIEAHGNSRYYLPIDPNDEDNPEYMTPKTKYSMQQGVRKLGINNIDVVVDQKFSFNKYLVGSVFDTEEAVFAKVVEQKETPFEDISYNYSITMEVDEAKKVYDTTHHRNKFIFGYKMADTNFGFLKLADVKPKAADVLSEPVPEITDTRKENERIK